MADSIQEIRYQVGEAWKGTYSNVYPYGVANVVQDPTGLSVYRSLKSGNTGHPLTDTSWWFCIIDLSSIKQKSDNIDALNQQVSQDEAARVQAEQSRATAEQGRVNAEGQRVTAEQGRVNAEGQRVTAEQGRELSETAREQAESGRVTAENARVLAEQGRVTAEDVRNQAETLRDQAESNRASAENNRASAENQRHQQYTADHALSQELNSHPMRINTSTLMWEAWDAVHDTYVDTGIFAMSTPYATFEVNQTTGQLECTTDAYYNGPEFSLDQNNGNLQITI